MHHANVLMKERYKLFREAFKAATLLDGPIPIELDGKVKPRVVHWSGKLPNFAKHLRTWGKAGTVKTKTPTTAKLADRGMHCMFVGYALDHAGDVYHMWNPKTGWVHETCDVIWLCHMYFKKPAEQEEIRIMPTLVGSGNLSIFTIKLVCTLFLVYRDPLMRTKWSKWWRAR
jgi:hypothetical protein